MNPIDRLRRALGNGSEFDEAVARKQVSEFIAGLRVLGETEGPWAFANLFESPDDAEPRQIAYLAVWHDGPQWNVWDDLHRFDAVDLAIDALAEGFDAFLSVYPRGRE